MDAVPVVPLVRIVDDDASLCAALDRLLRSAGYAVETYTTVAEFARQPAPDGPCCLLLDVHLQDMSGLELQEELARQDGALPVVFMTGHGDIPMTVRAMRAGAVDFLPKPVGDQALLDAVALALARDRERRDATQAHGELQARFATLTVREREVMALATAGRRNKQIAGELGVSEITVKIHRGNAMRKMGARTFADLVRMAQALGQG